MNELIARLGKAFGAWRVLYGEPWAGVPDGDVNFRLFRRAGLWQASFNDYRVEPPQATPEDAVRRLLGDFLARARDAKKVEDDRAKKIADAAKALEELGG